MSEQKNNPSNNDLSAGETTAEKHELIAEKNTQKAKEQLEKHAKEKAALPKKSLDKAKIITMATLGSAGLAAVLSLTAVVIMPKISQDSIRGNFITLAQKMDNAFQNQGQLTTDGFQQMTNKIAANQNHLSDMAQQVSQLNNNMMQLNANLKTIQGDIQTLAKTKGGQVDLSGIESKIQNLSKSIASESHNATGNVAENTPQKAKVVSGNYVARTPNGAIIKVGESLMTVSLGQETSMGKVTLISNDRVKIGQSIFKKTIK